MNTIIKFYGSPLVIWVTLYNNIIIPTYFLLNIKIQVEKSTSYSKLRIR